MPAPASTTLIPITSETYARYGDVLSRVYARGFGDTTEAGDRFVTGQLRGHMRYTGFSGLIALDETERAVGFVYGYHSEPGQFWRGLITPDLVAHGHEAWLDDVFEYVEFAVDPDYQGRGIGGRLHDTLLLATTEQRALLSAEQGDGIAPAMYRARGWVPLVPNFQDEEIMLMGLDLAAFRVRHGGKLPFVGETIPDDRH
jgi:GNAT superfamily N-acetyltransferase